LKGPIILIAIIFIAAPAVGLASKVTVSVQWKYEGIPAKMQLYGINQSKKAYLWQTKNVTAFTEIPAANLIDKPIILNKGSGKNFVLVYHNKTDKPLYFFAAPHSMSPKKYTLGFKFHCLCVNHAFEVKPKHYWYRVIRMNVSKYVEGNELNIVHTLVRIDKGRKQRFSFNNSHKKVSKLICLD